MSKKSHLNLPSPELSHAEDCHVGGGPGPGQHQRAVPGRRHHQEVRDLVLVVRGQHVDVVQREQSSLRAKIFLEIQNIFVLYSHRMYLFI